ncbi:MAG TPA: hypothetical protein PK245_00085, partial [Clostridia bacterium]|nr:hypothetical protein [Clostridia bacterium]
MAIFKKKKLKTEDIGSEESMFPAMPEDKPEEPKKAAGPDVDKLVGEADALSLISGSFPAGSAGDIALARALRDNAASAAGAKARLEPFYARPLLGKNSLIILAVLYLFCLILYFGYAPLALAVLVLFMPVAVFLVLGRKTFSFLLPKKTAYNAVAYRDFGKKITKTIIISSNYDGEYGTPYSTGKLKRAAPVFIIYSFASIFVLFLFCILKIVFGFDTPAEKAALSVIPLLLCLLGVGFFATYTSWDKNNIE